MQLLLFTKCIGCNVDRVRKLFVFINSLKYRQICSAINVNMPGNIFNLYIFVLPSVIYARNGTDDDFSVNFKYANAVSLHISEANMQFWQDCVFTFLFFQVL